MLVVEMFAKHWIANEKWKIFVNFAQVVKFYKSVKKIFIYEKFSLKYLLFWHIHCFFGWLLQ